MWPILKINKNNLINLLKTMLSNNSVDQFLEKLQSISPSSKKKPFVKRRTIDKVFCGFVGNHGKYQLLPFNSVVTDFPFVTLFGTREVNMPRKNMAPDGTETVYNAWIRILPEEAYMIKDPNTGGMVSSLSADDRAVLKQAQLLHEELYNEVDAKANALNPEVKSFIRKKNYTIWNAYVVNYWQPSDMRQPARSNFSALFVVTAKGFIDLVNSSIQDTNLTAGLTNPNWISEIYNRNLSGRTGMLMFSISKPEAQAGFNITVTNNLGMGSYLGGININPEDGELMSNPVEEFLGWQANHDEDTPIDQRKLFNRPLMEETIRYMMDQLACIRTEKQRGGTIADAIQATNDLVLKNQVHTNTRGQATNDPVLSQMAASSVDTTKATNIQAQNNDPYQTPPAAHFDPVSGVPTSNGNGRPAAPFTAPSFATEGGDMPF